MSRSRLLTAAAAEFAKHGLKGTRVQGIVRRAGVNERMIYHYFGSKEGLYQAVLDAERSALAGEWYPYLQRAEGMEPLDGMRTVLGGLFDLMVERPQLLALLVHEWLSTGTFSLPSADQLPGQFRAVYARGQRQGVFAQEPTFEVAYGTLLGALVGQVIFVPWYHEATVPHPDRSDVREHVLRQVLHGIVPHGRAGSTAPSGQPHTGKEET